MELTSHQLNDRHQGALQSKRGGHLNGRFPNFGAQKRSGRNPPLTCHLMSWVKAFPLVGTGIADAPHQR